MWNQWFKKKYKKISFEDVQFAVEHNTEFILINTIPNNDQKCLIQSTISSMEEEQTMNEYIQLYDFKTPKIIVYGKNDTDITVEKKCEQLLNLGFMNVYMYQGGMFEWLLLQDIYGKVEFPTTSKMLDILKYKPQRQFGGILLK